MSKKIFMVAGGTGGHVFPCVATAQVLKEQGHDVTWVTDDRGLKYQSHWVNEQIIKTPVFSTNNKTKFMVSLGFSFIKSFVKILTDKPDVVVGFGGYPSLPMLLAAQMLNVKTIIHESNAVLGKANILLRKRAHYVAVSFSDPHPKSVLTGNPIRPDIVKFADNEYKPSADKINLLVFGGSLGAQVFNDIVPQVFEKMTPKERKKFCITQQVVNENMRGFLSETYDKLGLDATILPFIENMPKSMRDADIIISRSGASTVAEITSIGRAAVLIPYPFHADNQQYANAKALVDVGSAVLLDEKAGSTALVEALFEFLYKLPDLKEMAKSNKLLGQPKAAWTFADLIIKTA